MGDVEPGGHFDGRCSFSTPQEGSRVSRFTHRFQRGPGRWGAPSAPGHQPADGERDNTHLSLTRWLGWRLNSECLSEKLPQEKQSRRLSDGHPALKFLSKCPDSGCEQGYHTVKRTGSDSERNGCVFRETEVGFSHQPTPPHLH